MLYLLCFIFTSYFAYQGCQKNPDDKISPSPSFSSYFNLSSVLLPLPNWEPNIQAYRPSFYFSFAQLMQFHLLESSEIIYIKWSISFYIWNIYIYISSKWWYIWCHLWWWYIWCHLWWWYIWCHLWWWSVLSLVKQISDVVYSFWFT